MWVLRHTLYFMILVSKTLILEKPNMLRRVLILKLKDLEIYRNIINFKNLKMLFIVKNLLTKEIPR